MPGISCGGWAGAVKLKNSNPKKAGNGRTDGHTDGHMDIQIHPLIESLARD